MKKAIIIVVVIAVVILVGIVLLGSTAQPQLQQAIQTTSAAATDAQMKAVTAQLMVAVGQYYMSGNATTSFENNQANITAVNNLFTQLKAQKSIDATYSIHSTANNFVAKTMITGASSFYCADSVSSSAAVVMVPVSGSNFTSATDCSGQPLK